MFLFFSLSRVYNDMIERGTYESRHSDQLPGVPEVTLDRQRPDPARARSELDVEFLAARVLSLAGEMRRTVKTFRHTNRAPFVEV